MVTNNNVPYAKILVILATKAVTSCWVARRGQIIVGPESYRVEENGDEDEAEKQRKGRGKSPCGGGQGKGGHHLLMVFSRTLKETMQGRERGVGRARGGGAEKGFLTFDGVQRDSQGDQDVGRLLHAQPPQVGRRARDAARLLIAALARPGTPFLRRSLLQQNSDCFQGSAAVLLQLSVIAPSLMRLVLAWLQKELQCV